MHVLVVDDEPDLRLILRINLERWGHTVVLAGSAQEAWEALGREPVDAMLLDVSMPGETGLELLARLRADARRPPEVALLTAMIAGPSASLPGAEGVRVLAKPFGVEQLRSLVDAMAAGGGEP